MSSADEGREVPPQSAHDVAVPPALTEIMTTGWATMSTPPRHCDDSSRRAAARHRERLCLELPDRLVVIPSGIPRRRAGDQPFPFRTSSDFIWLTGSQEPYAVLVMDTSDPDSAKLYRHPGGLRSDDRFWTDRELGELWTGRRPGQDLARVAYGVRCADLDALPRSLPSAAVVRGSDSQIDAMFASTPGDSELTTALARLRLVKDDWETAQLRAAVNATVSGFVDIRDDWSQVRRQGERFVDATFLRRARLEGNGVGYSSICASGSNASTLHWTANDGPVGDDDLVLIDVGVEMDSLYTADITRVLPASGRFSAEQRDLYQVVLDAQEAALSTLRPGVAFRAAHQAAIEVITDGLIATGILRVSKDEALDPERQLYRRYTLCGTGHMLGLDVHDCGSAAPVDYPGGQLHAGHVLTVEPGIYLQPDDLTVPPQLRGTGIRIEDDVLVTANGYEILSASLPRRPDDVESWLAGSTYNGSGDHRSAR